MSMWKLYTKILRIQMEVRGKYKLEFYIEFDNGTMIPYDLLKSLFFGNFFFIKTFI